MARIDELQERLPDGGLALSPTPAVVVGAASDDAGPPDDGLSRDVLAGRTSFVRRAVDGDLGQPASLAGQAIAVVHARLRDNVQPAELAGELAVSLRTLERGLAAELGCSPRQLILAMKMREAHRLLESGRFRVNEVASRLGFATPSHFSRSFRAFYRIPPSSLARGSRI
jgi:transcriptional regulator GlxA family with amidase domain